VSRFFKSAAFPILIVVVLAFFAQKLISPGQHEKTPNYSDFLSQVDSGMVKNVTINTKDNSLDVQLRQAPAGEHKKYDTAYPDNTEQNLVNTLRAHDVPIQVKGKGGGGWITLLTNVLPFVIFLLFWLFIINQMQGGGSKVMSFGKSRAKRMSVDAPKITFRDVAGVDEAVEELQEIKEFLENPKKFQALGARIPKGVLLYGPPGTGKTLLARAVAGEAGGALFSI
jgi:cell division protease FtsH